ETSGWGSEISLRYGAFLEQLEFIADIEYRRDKVEYPAYDIKRSGMSRTVLGAKYLFYDPHKKRMNEKPNLYSWKANNSFSWKRLIPAIGFYAGVNFNLGENDFTYKDDPSISPKLMLITQSQFGKNVFVANIISERLNSDDPTWSYIATLTHGFSEEWSGFIENHGIKSSNYSDFIFRGGAAYLLAENFQLDASVGFSTKNTPSIMTAAIGFSWRFDKDYMPSILPSADEEKTGEKPKEKKRKDEVETE
ncbi:MAG: transporter, partial [Flavobacterium sp.]|nr:transporter [Flavobacterium sp.]